MGRIPPDRHGESRRIRLLGLAWLAAWELARAVPEPVAFAAADLTARVAHARPAVRARVHANLARTLRPPGVPVTVDGRGVGSGAPAGERLLGRAPADAVPPAGDGSELDGLVREAFRSYARYWVEAFRAADLEPGDLDARTTTGGFEHLDAALERGRGVVVVLAHHGSWDVAARWAETHGYHLAVVAEVVRPRRLFARFVQLREAIGLEVVPLARRAAPTAALRRVLAANHLAGLLADRDLGGGGVTVDLFGAPARLPRGAAALAQATGAALVPITMLQRPGRRWHLQVLPEVDVGGLDADAATQRVAAAIEDLVRLDPAQWHAAFSDLWS